MNPVRKRRLLLVLFIATILVLAAGLVLFALRQNISLFYTPTQVAAGEVSDKQPVRLGGMVVKGSVVRTSGELSVRFGLTDFNRTVTVVYRGILPDLFREEQGIVAYGTVDSKGQFNASEVLAKHDANYMPPEVKNALAKSKELRSRSKT